MTLTAAERRALEVAEAHPRLPGGVPCSRVSTVHPPSIHTPVARRLAARGLLHIRGVTPCAMLSAAGVAALDRARRQDDLTATGF